MVGISESALAWAGHRLQCRLHDQALDRLGCEQLHEALFATRSPIIFAESNVRGDSSDWTQPEFFDYGGLSLRGRPLTEGNADKSQLCPPDQYAGVDDDFSARQFFRVVAWDPVSWPGNYFWGGSKATDEGVKAAATSVMSCIERRAGHLRSNPTRL